MSTITKPNTMPATAMLVFDEPTTFVDRSLPTASWWDKYEVQPGAYAFEWVTANGYPWNPDPEAITGGFIANVGPQWARVTVRARLVEEYRVNRLLSESRADHRLLDEEPVVMLSRTVYPWQVPGSPKGDGKVVLKEFLGGRVEPIEREDNYPGVTECLSDAEYVQLRWAAMRWYAEESGFAEWDERPTDWRLWNGVNARYEGHMVAFVETMRDAYFPIVEHFGGDGWYAVIGGTRTVIDGPLDSWQEMREHVNASAIHRSGYEIRYIDRGHALEWRFLPAAI